MHQSWAMLPAGMCVLKTGAERSLNSFVFPVSFVRSFSAPLSLGVHCRSHFCCPFPSIPAALQLWLSISLCAQAGSLCSSWVTCFCFHFSTSFSCLSSARCSFIHISLLPGLLDFPRVGRSLWFEAALMEIRLSWADGIYTPHFHTDGDPTSLIQSC